MLIKCSNAEVWFEIDDEDYNLLEELNRTWRWKQCGPKTFYVACSMGKGKTLYLHQFLMRPPKGFDVHHKDENTANNKRSNLVVEEALFHRARHLAERRSFKKDKKLF